MILKYIYLAVPRKGNQTILTSNMLKDSSLFRNYLHKLQKNIKSLQKGRYSKIKVTQRWNYHSLYLVWDLLIRILFWNTLCTPCCITKDKTDLHSFCQFLSAPFWEPWNKSQMFLCHEERLLTLSCCTDCCVVPLEKRRSLGVDTWCVVSRVL